jgi:hypothetical protein
MNIPTREATGKKNATKTRRHEGLIKWKVGITNPDQREKNATKTRRHEGLIKWKVGITNPDQRGSEGKPPPAGQLF